MAEHRQLGFPETWYQSGQREIEAEKEQDKKPGIKSYFFLIHTDCKGSAGRAKLIF
jgi:hypothetical protein